MGIASAILLAAYGAHGLEDAFKETPRKERAWGNAVDYQMFHGLALLVIGFYGGSGKSLGGPFSLIKVTPFGVILFFVSWVLIAVYGFINLKGYCDES